MKCLKCGEEMVLRNKDNSFNYKVTPQKKYERDLYWCEKDDIWISVEIPSNEK